MFHSIAMGALGNLVALQCTAYISRRDGSCFRLKSWFWGMDGVVGSDRVRTLPEFEMRDTRYGYYVDAKYCVNILNAD
jgi:hypothetical protein